MERVKVNELRLGNLVTDEFYDSFKTIIKVGSIDNNGINLVIEDDGNYPEVASRWIAAEYKFGDLRPIPLSPEILEQAGFKKDTINWTVAGYYKDLEEGEEDCRLMIHIDGNTWMFNHDKGYGVSVQPSIQSVHQLQNLYYCLTGTELTIKL